MHIAFGVDRNSDDSENAPCESLPYYSPQWTPFGLLRPCGTMGVRILWVESSIGESKEGGIPKGISCSE